MWRLIHMMIGCLRKSIMNEKCSLCKQIFEPSKFSTWLGPNGEALEIPEFDVVLADVDDAMICEACYQKGAAEMNYPHNFELHYQFGLEFEKKDRIDEARKALQNAIAIEENPKALSALAVTHDGKAKIELLMKALKIDPDCELARLNLLNEKIDPDEILKDS